MANRLELKFSKFTYSTIFTILSRQGVGFLASLISSILLFRVLGAEQFGFWAYIIALMSIPNLFVQPILTSLLRTLPDEENNKKYSYFLSIFQLAVGIWAIISAILLTFIFMPNDILNIFSLDSLTLEQKLYPILILIIKYLIEFFNTCIAAYCAALLDIRRQQLALLVKRLCEVLSIFIISVFFSDKDSLLSIVAGYLCCIEILFFIFWIRWLWNSCERSQFEFIKIEFFKRTELQSLTAPLLGISLTSFLGRRAGIFLFGYFGLYNEVAILSIVERVFSLANKFSSNFLHALLPFYSRVNASAILPIIITIAISFGHGIAGNFLYLTGPLWLQLWDISIDDTLTMVLFLLAVNTICLGYLQSSSQLLLQSGILTFAFRVSLYRRLIFFAFLYFYHSTLIDVVLAETVSMFAAVVMYLVFSKIKRSLQFLSIMIVSLFLCVLISFYL